VYARRSRATRRQNNPGGLSKPFPIGNEPQKTVKPVGLIAFGPCCELVLHFADYQRSSPHTARYFALQATQTIPLRHVTNSASMVDIRVNSFGIPPMSSLVHVPDLKRIGEAAGRSLFPSFPQVDADAIVWLRSPP